MISADQLVERARSFIGVPWQHQGRTEGGLDCIGLFHLSFESAGDDLSQLIGAGDRTNYGRGAQPELLQMVRQCCVQIYEPIDGCLIVMKFPQERFPRHFGIYTKGNIIHADARAGKVVEHGYRGLWQRCQHSLWKIPGVSYEEEAATSMSRRSEPTHEQ